MKNCLTCSCSVGGAKKDQTLAVLEDTATTQIIHHIATTVTATQVIRRIHTTNQT